MCDLLEELPHGPCWVCGQDGIDQCDFPLGECRYTATAPGSDFDPSAFLRLLRTLKTFPDPATLVPGIPQMFADQIDLHLLGALAWLRKFNEEWKSHTLIQALPDEEHDDERWA
jgi:hypothetical protein